MTTYVALDRSFAQELSYIAKHLTYERAATHSGTILDRQGAIDSIADIIERVLKSNIASGEKFYVSNIIEDEFLRLFGDSQDVAAQGLKKCLDKLRGSGEYVVGKANNIDGLLAARLISSADAGEVALLRDIVDIDLPPVFSSKMK